MWRDIWEGLKRMFTRNDISKVLNVDAETTSTMLSKIKDWRNMLDGKASWTGDYVKSLGIENGICREFADVVLTELEAKVSNNRLEALFQKNIAQLNETLQDGIGLGSFILKPLGSGLSEFVTPDKFMILSFGNDKKPNDVAFFDFRQVGNTYYTRIERHSVRNGYLEISNMALRSNNKSDIGIRTSLDAVPEWSSLPEEVAYPAMMSMDCGYYRNPLPNNIDNTPCGISFFDKATEHIRRADNQGARLDWEFESGERAIHTDNRALKDNLIAGKALPKLNKRLYRGLNLGGGDESLIKEFSPAFRDVNIINGLETILRQIEFIVGLSYGDLSNTQNVEKTAEEIRASKQRKYNRVNAIQENLKDCLEDFISGLAFHEGLLTTGFEFVCTFKDSIKSDEDKERQRDREDVAMGVMSLVEYRMKWYGESKAEAIKNIPEQTLLIPNGIG